MIAIIFLSLFLSEALCQTEATESRCSGNKPVCLERPSNPTKYHYWYNDQVADCVQVTCAVPNVTFATSDTCLAVCSGRPQDVADFSEETEKLAPEDKLNYPSQPDSSHNKQPLAVVVGLCGVVGAVGMVAVAVIGAMYVRRRTQDQHNRKQIANMLNMLSDSSTGSDDDLLYYNSSDNAEDNNLFDRLDREW